MGYTLTGAANSIRFARHTKCDEMTHHHLCRGGSITVKPASEVKLKRTRHHHRVRW